MIETTVQKSTYSVNRLIDKIYSLKLIYIDKTFYPF